jgi:hypothetical protein
MSRDHRDVFSCRSELFGGLVSTFTIVIISSGGVELVCIYLVLQNKCSTEGIKNSLRKGSSAVCSVTSSARDVRCCKSILLTNLSHLF